MAAGALAVQHDVRDAGEEGCSDLQRGHACLPAVNLAAVSAAILVTLIQGLQARRPLADRAEPAVNDDAWFNRFLRMNQLQKQNQKNLKDDKQRRRRWKKRTTDEQTACAEQTSYAPKLLGGEARCGPTW